MQFESCQARYFSSQECSEVYSTSYSVGTGPLFLGVSSWGVRLTTYLHLVLKLRISGAVPPLVPPLVCGFTAYVGTALIEEV